MNKVKEIIELIGMKRVLEFQFSHDGMMYYNTLQHINIKGEPKKLQLCFYSDEHDIFFKIETLNSLLSKFTMHEVVELSGDKNGEYLFKNYS